MFLQPLTPQATLNNFAVLPQNYSPFWQSAQTFPQPVQFVSNAYTPVFRQAVAPSQFVNPMNPFVQQQYFAQPFTQQMTPNTFVAPQLPNPQISFIDRIGGFENSIAPLQYGAAPLPYLAQAQSQFIQNPAAQPVINAAPQSCATTASIH